MVNFECDTTGCERREVSQVKTAAGTEMKCKQCADVFRQGRKTGERENRETRTVLE